MHPVDDPRFAGASLMIVNRNFGCGSSREHAPQGIVRWGVRGMIGESFSEIFFGNSVMLGMPAVTAAAADVAALQAAVEREPLLEIRLDLQTMRATAGALDVAVHLPAAARDALVTGRWDGLAPAPRRLRNGARDGRGVAVPARLRVLKRPSIR